MIHLSKAPNGGLVRFWGLTKPDLLLPLVETTLGDPVLLKYFFIAYRDASGPRWGSRFMKAVGTVFLGSPEKKGLGHLREDIQEQFYYCKEDRVLPPPEELQEWRNNAILANEYRQEELPACARAVFRVNAFLAVVVVCVAAMVPHSSNVQVDATGVQAQSLVGGLLGKVRGNSPAASNDPNCQQIAAYRSALTGQQLDELRRAHPHCF